jgi:hypothetical protein
MHLVSTPENTVLWTGFSGVCFKNTRQTYLKFPLTLPLSTEACLREVPPCGTKAEGESWVKGDIVLEINSQTSRCKTILLLAFARNPAHSVTSGQISSSFLRKQESSILFKGSGFSF